MKEKAEDTSGHKIFDASKARRADMHREIQLAIQELEKKALRRPNEDTRLDYLKRFSRLDYNRPEYCRFKDDEVFDRLQTAFKQEDISEELACDYTSVFMEYSHHRVIKPVLIYGEPGCGKSYSVRAAANSIGMKYIGSGAADITMRHGWTGEAGTYECNGPGFPAECQMIAGRAAVVLGIDEIDKVPDDSSGKRFMSELLTFFDHPEACYDNCLSLTMDYSDLIIVLTANSLDSISDFLLRRCHIIHVNSCSSDRLIRIIAKKMKDDWRLERIRICPEGIINAVLILYDAGVHAISTQEDMINSIMNDLYRKSLLEHHEIQMTERDCTEGARNYLHELSGRLGSRRYGF